jgi:hypothetical protein
MIVLLALKGRSTCVAFLAGRTTFQAVGGFRSHTVGVVYCVRGKTRRHIKGLLICHTVAE